MSDPLKRYTIPLLTIWESEDKVILIEYAEDGKIQLPYIIVEVIQICGHWLQMENAGQASRVLIDFLEIALIAQAQQKS